MDTKKRCRPFFKDQYAVSEEFTTLPALVIIMVGFTLFIVLVANTYSAYEYRMESLEKYQNGCFIVTKLTNPDSYFIENGKIIKSLLDSDKGKNILENYREQCWKSGIDFIVRVTVDDVSYDYPIDLPSDVGDRIAVSKSIVVSLNPVNEPAGRLTVILWGR